MSWVKRKDNGLLVTIYLKVNIILIHIVTFEGQLHCHLRIMAHDKSCFLSCIYGWFIVIIYFCSIHLWSIFALSSKACLFPFCFYLVEICNSSKGNLSYCRLCLPMGVGALLGSEISLLPFPPRCMQIYV